MIPYIYCFIRKDLEPHYQIIQAAHATHEIALKLSEKEKPHRTSHLILFEVKDEQQLLKIKDQLERNNIFNHIFHEPDINQHTSICTAPMYGDDRKFFKKFKMFKPFSHEK